MSLKSPKNPKILDSLNNALTILLKYGIAPLASGKAFDRILKGRAGKLGFEVDTTLNIWQRVRLATQELGPTAVNFAKFLCSRPDILPQELISEFYNLEFKSEPFLKSTAVEIFEKSTNFSVEKTFSYFDNYSFIQDGYSRTFRAKLLTGEDVAIKILLPEAYDNAVSDIKLLKRLAFLFSGYLKNKGIDNPLGIINAFEKLLMKKFDLTREAEMIKRFAKAYKQISDFVVPDVFSRYSTQSILVTTYYNSVSITDANEFLSWGLDHRKVSDTFLKSYISGMLNTGLFVGQLSDGAVRIMPDGRVLFWDFGSTRLLTTVQRNLICDIVAALTTQNSKVLANSLRKISYDSEIYDYRAFKDDVQYLVDNLYFMESSEHYMREFSFGIMRIAYKHKIAVPGVVFTAFTALSNAEDIALSITPTCLISEFFKPYGKKLQLERMSPERFKNHLTQNLSQAGDFLENSPLELSIILKKIRRGELSGNLNITDFRHFIRRIDVVANKLIYTLFIVVLILSSTVIMVFSGDSYKVFSVPLFSLIGFAAASFLTVLLILYALGTRFRVEEKNDTEQD